MSQQTIKKYKKDDIILAQGQTGRVLFRLFAGEVGLYIHYGRPGQRQICVLTAPDFFGEICALTGGPCAYTAVALRPVTALYVPDHAIASYLESNPQNAVQLLQLIARRTAFLEATLQEVGTVYRSGSGRAFSRLMQKETGHELPPPEHQECLTPSDILHVMTDEAHQLEEEAATLQKEVDYLKGSAISLEQEAAMLEAQIDRPAAPAAESIFLPGHRRYPGVTHPEYKSHLFTKSYVCPCCKEPFTTQQTFFSDHHLVAGPTPEEARYDLRIFYKDFDPAWYDVITCPSCYFSALYDFFALPKMLRRERFEAKLLHARSEVWLDMEAERDLDFVFSQHYLALACAEGFSNYRLSHSRLWTNLYWLYKGEGDDDMAALAEARAREASEAVYRECDLTPAQSQHICLQVASMYRRAGDFKTAREWAMRVRSNRMGKEAYRRLAESFIEDVREDAERLEAAQLAAQIAAKREAERLAEQEQAQRLQQEAAQRAAKKAEQKAAQTAAIDAALGAAQGAAQKMAQSVAAPAATAPQAADQKA